MTNAVVQNDIYEFPLSVSQNTFLAIDQLSESTIAYHIPLGIKISGPLNVSALEQAFHEVIKRHEILRTVYIIDADKQSQRVFSGVEVPVEKHALPATESDADIAVEKIIKERINQVFDLTSDFPVRAGLIRVAESTHVFYVVFHHIAVDHFAVIQFMEELSALYELYAFDGEPLSEPELQYADYVMWTRENPEDTQQQLAYWKAQLEEQSGFLNLPTDKRRPEIPSGGGQDFRFEFPAELVAKIKPFCAANNISLYMFFLASLNVLLARLSGQKDITVGSPFTTRSEEEELQNVMGCFINMLPLAMQLRSDITMRELVSAVTKNVLQAFDNQSIPFVELVNALLKERNLAINPLFQVGYVFQEAPAAITMRGLDCEMLTLSTEGAMYDLHVWMWEAQGSIGGQITYSTDLFERESIAHFIECLQTLTAGLIDNPERSVFDVPLLPASDVALIDTVNATQRDYATTPFVELIARQASHCADKPAALFSNQDSLTYAELDKKSNQLAQVLVERGVQSGDFIGVCVERNQYMLLSVLAVLKAGAAYVPLDPAYPEDRLAYMVEAASIELLLMTAAVSHTLPEYTGQKFVVDTSWDSVAQQSDNFASRATADGLAYVIFTSGSTGKPKGVQVPHRAVSNFLLSMQDCPGFCETDRLLAVTTLSFDIAVLELYLPLISGGTVIVADTAQAADGVQLKTLIEANNINIMQATPSTWRGLLAAGFSGGEKFRVLCGGEAFPGDLAEALSSCCAEVWNMFGPTETTVWSTCYRIPQGGEPLLIGRPIANTQIYVLDEHCQQVPVGVSGELYIGGDGVTCGYLGRDDLTRERFIDNPFGQGQLYRTGDLVRLLASGDLEYFNRIDNQVKVRGFRIELGEIEAVLAAHPAIEQVIVEVKTYSALDQRLVAYARFKTGESLTVTEVRKYLRKDLPDYMVPQLLVEVDEFPLTPNGKIDRKRLPNPFSSIGQSREFREPVTSLQKQIAEIWSRQLGIDAIGLDDNFFEVGGHSMLAMFVIHEIEDKWGCRVRPATMIARSLEQLVTEIEQVTGVSEASGADDSAVSEGEQPGVVDQPALEGGEAERGGKNTSGWTKWLKKIVR